MPQKAHLFVCRDHIEFDELSGRALVDDEGGELGERRVEQTRLGAVDVGVDRGAIMGGAGVDDVPRLGAFQD